MFIFLDIGFTLLGGPAQGPAGRLVKHWNLPAGAKDWLNRVLFETPLESPGDLAQRMVHHFGLKETNVLPWVKDLWERQVTEAEPLPGARAALQQLREAQIPFGFITNIWPPFLAGFARCFPEEYHACPMFASCALGLAKPDPQLYRTALRQTGTDPREGVMIGDTYENDVLPAHGLGMRTIWVLTRPDKERSDLVAVLNGEKPLPGRTLTGMEQFHPRQLQALFT
ncbi:MAG: HAD family hydrolase [Magnetococcales bacterium]|nr:HAD family hydrolase [Magnetococcales bacterium]MBF0151103.1 HAD family hydrolase [Magnetococcales bacterium]MBF0174019.1 HAD family hydrolase [Magnetococcales bacterium]MBF0346766.1 HAD family hydrolase [Magnetococcales bacterium]MBF0630987.1 HAD family hydrolase [Magnetococcales bacterium]